MTFSVPRPWKLDKAKAFLSGSPVFPKYIFPFTALDTAPGGMNLGRIEWHVELVPARKVKGRKSISAIALWATQTRDPRYLRKVFYLPCFSDAITSQTDRSDFVKHVWRQGFCETHGLLILSAYPRNDHAELVVEVGSSISNDIYFQRDEAQR